MNVVLTPRLVPHLHHVAGAMPTSLYSGQTFRVKAEGDKIGTIIRIVSVSRIADVTNVYFSMNSAGVHRLTLDEFFLKYPNRQSIPG